MLTVLQALVAIGVLTLGRELFWLFVGGIGFMLGIELASRVMQTESDALTIVTAGLLGVVGAGLALFLQRLTVTAAGFAGGAVIASGIISAIGFGGNGFLPALAGGIVGAVLVHTLFDWALIILSTTAGALWLTQALELQRPEAAAAFLALLVIGLAVQGRQLASQPGRSRR